MVPRADGCATSAAPASPEVENAPSKTTAYISSWTQWAGEKRKKAFSGTATPPTEASSPDPGAEKPSARSSIFSRWSKGSWELSSKPDEGAREREAGSTEIAREAGDGAGRRLEGEKLPENSSSPPPPPALPAKREGENTRVEVAAPIKNDLPDAEGEKNTKVPAAPSSHEEPPLAETKPPPSAIASAVVASIEQEKEEEAPTSSKPLPVDEKCEETAAKSAPSSSRPRRPVLRAPLSEGTMTSVSSSSSPDKESGGPRFGARRPTLTGGPSLADRTMTSTSPQSSEPKFGAKRPTFRTAAAQDEPGEPKFGARRPTFKTASEGVSQSELGELKLGARRPTFKTAPEAAPQGEPAEPKFGGARRPTFKTAAEGESGEPKFATRRPTLGAASEGEPGEPKFATRRPTLGAASEGEPGEPKFGTRRPTLGAASEGEPNEPKFATRRPTLGAPSEGEPGEPKIGTRRPATLGAPWEVVPRLVTQDKPSEGQQPVGGSVVKSMSVKLAADEATSPVKAPQSPQSPTKRDIPKRTNATGTLAARRAMFGG